MGTGFQDGRVGEAQPFLLLERTWSEKPEGLLRQNAPFSPKCCGTCQDKLNEYRWHLLKV